VEAILYGRGWDNAKKVNGRKQNREESQRPQAEHRD